MVRDRLLPFPPIEDAVGDVIVRPKQAPGKWKRQDQEAPVTSEVRNTE